MTEIVIPQLDANSETAKLVQWDAEDGTTVARGEQLCTVETSKAIYDLEAESAGVLVRLYPEGSTVGFNVPIAYIAASAEEAEKFRTGGASADAASGAAAAEVNATKKAAELAKKHNVDLAAIGSDGIITEGDVQAYLKKSGKLAPERPVPGALPGAVKRVVVIAAGYGAMQVIDILLNYPDVRVVGCLDDDTSMHGKEIYGAPVVGNITDLGKFWEEKFFDYAIVAISTNIRLRKKFFDECVRLGIPMINAIDPTVRINRGAVLGSGNVICSQCHIGVAAQIGDNNFISAHTSIDHHNVWGSHITTGPNCATSGGVTVGDEVKFGTGIFIQPGITIGRESIVASGAIIIRSVPERHAVKVRLQTEVTAL